MDQQILAKTIAEELGTVIATLLGAESRVRPDGAPSSAVWALRFAVQGTLQGTATLLIPADDAGRLTSKVLGFEDDPPDEAVIDNLQEIAKQVASSLNNKPALEGVRLSADELPASQASAPLNTSWVAISVGDLVLKAGLSSTLTIVQAAAPAPVQKAGPSQSASSSGRSDSPTGPGVPPNLDLILDMELPLWVRFGWTNMTLQALSKLGPGTTVDLERQPDDPVEVLVNNIVVAKGEVVVVSGNYGVRVTEVMSAQERIRSMGPAS